MNSFRNNHKRNRFRPNGDRNFRKRNGDSQKFNSDYSANTNFQRKYPGKNNHNASKLIDKYNDLAREALSKGDKILSENYFQHADHFTRILAEQGNNHSSKIQQNKIEVVSDNTKKNEKPESAEEKKNNQQENAET